MVALIAVTACKEEQKVTVTPEAVSASTAAALPKTIHYQCGDAAVEFTLLADGKADMKIANASYAMQEAISASGAKYDNIGDEATYLWNKGTQATVSIQGKTLPECVESSALAAGDTTWVLETLNKDAIVGNGRITIRFGEDGRVSGNSGCNNYTGSYTREGEKLEIAKNMVSTRRACLSDIVTTQEVKFLTTLSAMTSYTKDEAGALILSNAAGQELVFHKK